MKLELNFDKVVDHNKFDSDQIEELRGIYEKCNIRLLLFLANHPEINYDCLCEITQLAIDPNMNNEAKVGVIIQVLGIYTDYLKESDIKCCFERIRYGMYAIKHGLTYPYIQYLMCTDTMHKENIKDIYSCFINGISLARITEVIRTYSIYTKKQITQICNALIDIQHGYYDNKFLSIIQYPNNSAKDMSIIRREAIKLTKYMNKINKTSKAHKWVRVITEDA